MRADLALILFVLTLAGGIALLVLRKKRGGAPCRFAVAKPAFAWYKSARQRWGCIWRQRCCWCWPCAEKRKNIIGFHRYLKTAP